MNLYLEYLYARMKSSRLTVQDRKYAEAEYNRALDFARRNGLIRCA